MDGLAPYWAVGRAPPSGGPANNMEHFTSAYQIPTPTSTEKHRTQKIQFTIDFKAMRNTKAVSKDDVLGLPFFDEEA